MEYVNEVRLVGRPAAAPEYRVFGSGASLARLLVTVRLVSPSRTDVLPVTIWEPTREVLNIKRHNPLDENSPDNWVEIIGQVHRRFWTDSEGRHSRVEVVASEVNILSNDE